MKKKIYIGLVIVCLLGLGGFWLLMKETPVTAEEGQLIFNKAFLKTQTTTEKKEKADIKVTIGLSVTDNENDILPEALEALKGEIHIQYDFTDLEKVYGELSAVFFFNKSKEADLAFTIKLKKQKMSAILEKFSPQIALFLGIEKLLGGPDGAEALRMKYENKPFVQILSDDQYAKVLSAFREVGENEAIVVNSKDEEAAIAKAFVENKVIEIAKGTQKGDIKTLDFSIPAKSVVTFLNKVAFINDLERDFTPDTERLEKITITGQTIIDEANNLKTIKGQMKIDKDLIEKVQKDIFVDFEENSLSPTSWSWMFRLLNSDTQDEQAKLVIKWTVL